VGESGPRAGPTLHFGFVQSQEPKPWRYLAEVLDVETFAGTSPDLQIDPTGIPLARSSIPHIRIRDSGDGHEQAGPYSDGKTA
jgi:hypothetical protein